MTSVIVDTGPLLAYFDRSSSFHPWVRDQFQQLDGPLYSCEAVVTETLFLLKRDGLDPDCVLSMIERGDLRCAFTLWDDVPAVRRLLRKYRDLPATLADACLVRMAEILPRAVVLTLDKDFLVYRKTNRQAIPLLAPFV